MFYFLVKLKKESFSGEACMVARTKRKERHLPTENDKKKSTINTRDAKMTNKWTLGNAEQKKEKRKTQQGALSTRDGDKSKYSPGGLPLYLLVGREKLISLTDTEEKKHSTQSQHFSQ